MLLRFNQIKKIDWVLLVAVLLLVLVGLLSIYSVSQQEGARFFKRQLIYVVLGIALMMIFTMLDYRIFRDHSYILIFLYFFGVLLLLAVLFIGKEVRGASSWLSIGGIGFEPVEFVKLVIILMLAKYFSLRHIEVHRIKYLVVSALYVIIPLILLLLQPELGYVLILALIWLAIVLVAGIRIKHLIILGIIAVLLFSLGWSYALKDYQKQRVLSFLDPHADPLGSGYNIIQSIIAIGSGKIFGRGLGQGTQSQLNFLPEPHTDFIFASIAEEWGFVGSALVLLLFGIMLFRIIRNSLGSTNNFARLFCVGVAVMFVLQAVINIGMNMGLFPIVGIPLPLISYGGSNLIMNFVALGIVQSIVTRNK